jgi:hypothetical protein
VSDTVTFDLRTPEQRHFEEISELRDRVKALEIDLVRTKDELEYMRQLLDRMLVSPK